MFSTRIGKCSAEKRDRAGSAAGARPYFQHTTFGMHAQGIELPRHFRGLFQMHAIKRDSLSVPKGLDRSIAADHVDDRAR